MMAPGIDPGMLWNERAACFFLEPNFRQGVYLLENLADMVFLLFLTVLFLIEFYAFQGFRLVTGSFSGDILKLSLNWSYWLITSALLLFVVYGMFTYRKTHVFPVVSKWSINLFISIFVTKLIFIVFLLSEDLYRLVFGLGNRVFSDVGDSFIPERRLFMSQMGLAVASVPFISFLYGITKGKYNYKVHQLELFFDDLPASFDGFRIAQFSDFHSGSFDDVSEVKKGLEMLQDQNCDAIVFTGDLVNNTADEFEPYQDMFRQLSAPQGKYSILGNHDYGDYIAWDSADLKRQNLDKLCKMQKDAGFELLRDRNVRIEKDGESIYVCGVENWGIGFGKRGNLKKALENVPSGAFKFLLSHDPTHWENEVKNYPEQVGLCLSGHTHGAQMGVEIPGIKFSPVQFRYPHWAGLKKENGRYHYINRGFGFLGFAGRVGIWPEITVITLRSKKQI